MWTADWAKSNFRGTAARRLVADIFWKCRCCKQKRAVHDRPFSFSRATLHNRNYLAPPEGSAEVALFRSRNHARAVSPGA